MACGLYRIEDDPIAVVYSTLEVHSDSLIFESEAGFELFEMAILTTLFCSCKTRTSK